MDLNEEKDLAGEAGADADESVSTRDIIDRAVNAQLEKDDEAPKSGAEIDEQKAKRFAQAEREEAARKAREGAQASQAGAGAQGDQAPVLKAPVGWSQAARAAFDKLPTEVRDAVAKREYEVNEGFKALQEYKGLENYKGYIDLARQRDPNVSFASVMKNAVEWEASLQSNPEHTVRHIIGLAAQMRGVTPQQFIQRALGAPQAGQRPPGQPQPQPQPGLTPAHAQEIARREFAQLNAERESLSTVEKFMADPANPHAQGLGEAMAVLIEKGLATDLQGAYEMACWNNPEIRAQLINQQRASGPASDAKAQQIAKAKAAAKATLGAPRSGTPPPPKASSSKSVRDAIDAAVAAQIGDL